MEFINSFDPTPRLKSSLVPILFIPFNNDEVTCYYCKSGYSETLDFKQKYCKVCLFQYLKHTKDNNTYLDVHIKGYAQCIEHNEHEKSGNKDFCTRNIQEWCKYCSEISYFKQVVTKSSYNSSLRLQAEDHSKFAKIHAEGVKPFANEEEIGSANSIESTISTLIKKESGCEICGEIMFLHSSYFGYQVYSEWKESTLTKNPIPILYLPWWDTFNCCIACNDQLNFTSDCQKWCSNCFIIYIGCRYCLTTNVIFGITNQSQCRKCGRISFVAIGINSDLDKYLISTININHHKIANYWNDSNPLKVYKYIKDNYFSVVKWIPYSEITNVEKIAEGGFGIIYKANTFEYGTVVIKRFSNSQSIKFFKYFLNELKSLRHCYNHAFIMKLYGITRDPETKDYMLVMEYANGGDLHNFLKTNFTKITWNTKLDILWRISKGLECIHKVNSIHRNFHSGNILLSKTWKIGDLGLSQQNNILLNNEIYGIIPYIAPEIFNGTKFSKESDIYGFGMIMWELTTGYKPFANVEHNTDLINEIIDGKRPEITNDTPECFVNLMKECLSSNPLKRPSIIKICETIQSWHDNLYYYCFYENYYSQQNRNEIVEQFKQAEKKRLELKISKLYPEYKKSHPGAIYTSRPLNFLITKNPSVNSSSIISRNSKIKTLLERPNNKGYISKEYGFDIRAPSQNICFTVPRKRNVEELKIGFQAKGHISKEYDFDIRASSQNMCFTVPRRRNIEELKIGFKTNELFQNENQKRVRISNWQPLIVNR